MGTVGDPALRLAPDHPGLVEGLARIRAEFDVPGPHDPAVVEHAERVQPDLSDHVEATDLPLVTIDPPGSRDLDQAVHVEDLGRGRTRVWYAIADVGAFVRPGDPRDQEARARGVTTYLPDGRAGLYPAVLAEGRASLLPTEERPAALWRLDLASDGELVDVDVRRALVRSRAQLTYAQAQRALDGGTDAALARLAVVGRLRAEREWVRGGVSLPLADQELRREADGSYRLGFRAGLPIEQHNAQVSLLCGHAAARLQLEAGLGVLRTLPPPSDDAVDTLRRHAAALGIPWPAEVRYPDLVRTLDVTRPTHHALVELSTRTLRGAGYAAIDGAPPEQPLHGALAMPYSHVTAPLRRLVDRYATEVLHAATAGRSVAAQVRAALPELPALMTAARQRTGAVRRAALDLGEALVLEALGDQEPLTGTVVRADEQGARVQVAAPAVVARVPEPGLGLGEVVALQVAHVDVARRHVRLALRGRAEGPVLAHTGIVE